MNTAKKLLKFGECLNFSDENLKGRFVFQTAGAGGAGGGDGAKADKPPVAAPEATETGKTEKPEAQKSAEEKRAEALAESRAKLEAAKTATGTEATQKRLQEIAARKDAITEEKEHKIYPETKKLFGVKEPWVEKPLAIPEDKPYTANILGFPKTVPKQEIAQQVEDAMAKPNYAAILKDLMPDDMPLSKNNQINLRNVMTEIVDSYLHHVNPSVLDAKKYKDEVLLPRLENFITHFKQIAGNKKPIEMMILFSAFTKKIDPNFDFINKDGVLQPEQLKNILLVSNPIAILDLFEKDQKLDTEIKDLGDEKASREYELATAQKKEVDIGKMIKDGEIKFTPITITVPLEADKIDQKLKEEFAKTLSQNLDPQLREKAVNYLMEKAKDLKQPGKKFNLSENGELTPVTEADEAQKQKEAEETARKLTEQASSMAGNPDVKPGQESDVGIASFGALIAKFFEYIADLLKNFGGFNFGSKELNKNLEARLKNWTPLPTEEELKETGKFEAAMLKGIPKINKTNLAKLFENADEMRNHIFKSKPGNLSWETYLFDKQKGRITAEERAKLEDKKELKPSEISTMIMMKDAKAPEQPAAAAIPAVAPGQTPASTSPTNPEVAANTPPTAAPKPAPQPGPEVVPPSKPAPTPTQATPPTKP